MKKKLDLKRKVLYSLLAASTMGIFYSGSAFAASVNGVEVPDSTNGVITNEWLVNQAKSKKFVIAQGDKLVIATEGNVNSLIKDIQAANGDLNAIRKAIADHSVVGVIGGEGQLDTSLNGILSFAQLAGGIAGQDELQGLVEKVMAINTIGTEGDNVTLDGDTNLTIGQGEGNSPVVIGYIGGDMSVNTGVTGSLSITYPQNWGGATTTSDFIKHETSITRNGNINNFIKSGNVIGGIGGSTAITIGNITLNAGITANVGNDTVSVDLTDLKFDGKTTTTINGDINTVVAGNIDTTGNITEGSTANIGAFANGGAAVAIGGYADSIVKGNSNLVINSNVKVDGGLDGITAGVAGGGVALTTIGGTANSTVEGSTTINVQNGLAVGLIGGGVAGSGDATGAVEEIKGGQVGNDNGTSDLTLEELKAILGDKTPGFITDNIKDLNVTVSDAIKGGEATAKTGDTNINLTGNTTAIGVIGGGVAAASHTYTWKNDGTNETAGLDADDKNKAYGSSTATADTGKATIVVNLDSADPDNVAANIGGALSSVISAVKGGDLSTIEADGVVGQGAAVGVFGGGVAFGHGSLRGTIDSEGENAYGAHAVANNEGGADIYLLNGYAAGVFGGGAAGTLNNAKAETNTGAVNTYIGEGMKAVGVFGGGFAVSMEGEKSPDGKKGSTKGTLASSTVDSNNIVVDGKDYKEGEEVINSVDGIYGGGMAIGNSVLSADNYGKDAVTKVGTTNITVNSGTIDNLELISIMKASKNDNKDTWPQWSVLGFNASGAMVDLKGITDETSIAAGGMGMGMTGYSEVENANITINGGNVAKDILGGGIAVDNITGDKKDTDDVREGAGAHVGTSTITLNGGTVGGSVYAGGAINGTTPTLVQGKTDSEGVTHGYDASETSSTVGTATVVLNGTEVTGEISGQGYEMTTEYKDADADNKDFNPFDDEGTYEATYEKKYYKSVDSSTLEIIGNNTLKPLDNSDEKYTSNSKIHHFDKVNVEANSVTKVEGLTANVDNVDDRKVLFSDTKLNVFDGAYLDISNIDANETGNQVGKTYYIANNMNADSTYWDEDALTYDRMAGVYATTVVQSGQDGKESYDIKFDKITEENAGEAAQSMANALDANEINPLLEDGMLSGWENVSEGAKGYLDAWQHNPNMNTAFGLGMMIGEDSAVTGNTVSVARDVADEVAQHLSFTEDFIQDHDSIYGDDNIWAKYIHNKFETDGMSSSFGGITADNDYNGVIVGYDFNQSGKLQSGVAIHYGHGDGTGSFSRNDYDAWGVSLYGALKDEEAGTNLMADIGYTKTSNDITGTIAGKDLTADRDLTAWTIGVRGEKEFVSGRNQIVPYVGLRYMNIDPSSYTSYYNGKKAFEYDADKQDIWMVPLGVSFRNETKTGSGWRITPKLDVAYIWSFGDTDNSVDVNMAGASAPLYYTVMDDGSWLASLGVDASHGAWTFGAGYAYQKGDDTKNNKWYVNAGFAF